MSSVSIKVQMDPPQQSSKDMSIFSAIFLTAFLIGTGFFVLSEHNSTFFDRNAMEMSEEDIAESHIEQGQGNTKRKLAVLGFAFLSTLYVFTAKPANPLEPLKLGTICFFAWFAVCAASVLWSIDPSTTLRRVIALALFAWSAFGVAWRFSPRDLAKLITMMSVFFIVISLLLELRVGVFQPTKSGYRFAGPVHANMQATYCALVAIAGTALLLSKKNKPLLETVLGIGLFGFGFLFLLATKSRMSLGATIMVCGTLPLVRLKRNAFVFASIAGFIALFLICGVFSIIGEDLLLSIVPSRGPEEQSAASLNGRIPLWSALWINFSEASILGHGYSSFWTPDRIDQFQEEQEWSMQSAHSAYIDMLLSVGVVGSAFLLFAAISATIRCGLAAVDTRNFGYIMFFGVLVYSVLQGLLESHAVNVLFAGYVNLLAIYIVLFFRTATVESALPDELSPATT